MNFRIVICLVVSFCSHACFAALNLTLLQTTDISGLGFDGVGGMAFDSNTGSLWISDAGGDTNDIVSIDPLTGAVSTTFDASVIPGLGNGPDALALHPVTGNLFVFSTFNGAEAGVVSQAGALISDFGSNASIDAGGAAFRNATDLFVVAEDTGDLKTLDLTTGAVLTTTSLTNFSGRIGAADFDPVTGLLVAYSTNTQELLEIDVDTATVVSLTDVSAFLSAPSFPSGIGFNADGSRFYLVSGTGVGADELIVFSRVPEPSTCLLLLGSIGFLATGGLRKRRR